MKVKLTRIFTEDKVSPKTGKAYTSMSIKTEEHGDAWIKGFRDKANMNWAEGDTVEINIDTVESNGKTYLNFTTPKTKGSSFAPKVDLSSVEGKLDEILSILKERQND